MAVPFKGTFICRITLIVLQFVAMGKVCVCGDARAGEQDVKEISVK